MSTTTRAVANGSTTIEADRSLPVITIARDFDATPAQLVRAHIDPEIVVQWIGPTSSEMQVDYWDARTGGSWRYVSTEGGEEYGFHGCFHEIRDDRLVQTFTYEGFPDGVSLETMWFEDLADGRTRLHATSLFGSFEGRDAMLASGMEHGVNEGYAALDKLLASGTL